MASIKKTKLRCIRRSVTAKALVVSMLSQFQAGANPAGGTVSQGSATITTSGSQLIINTSDRAQINWSSFNIAVGETTTFNQPSASSVVWNQINDPNASQILGNLNANGYVVLQNQNGFYIGGSAVLSTHGLIMTTAATPPPDLSSGGAWSFNALPPTASIINYGQINIGGGGSAYLIADDIENNGIISAPSGNVSLSAGQSVLLSSRPDGRGVSARVTLPEGSVNNQGQIIADGGTIALNAQVVNQGGLIQANSVKNNNGVIELLASDVLNLGANSIITAKGDSTVKSQGGFVIAQAGNTFADTATSAINVSGNVGGVEGFVEILGQNISGINSVNSTIDGLTAANFSSAKNRLMLNASAITLSTSPTFAIAANPNINVGDLSSFSKIAFFSDSDITLKNTLSLSASLDPNACLTLVAARNLTLNNGTSISGAANWNVNLTAGTELTSVANRQSGLDGIYLNGNAFVRTMNGNINALAGNEMIIDDGLSSGLSVSGNGIKTIGGGSINATAIYGDVNTGGNPFGFTFNSSAPPYYKVDNRLGGISTAAGGDVTITAGGNVSSYLPRANDYQDAQFDGGTGAFGPQGGNVTITAGGSVFGHYVLANGIGTITAQNGDIGIAPPAILGSFALSLIKGNWNIFAPNGIIYLQEIRNPNGVFNDVAGQGSVADNGGNTGYHYFDYDPLASLLLDGKGVEITGLGGPDTPTSAFSPIPLMFPPTLTVTAGQDGFVLDANVNLFPSPFGEVHITTTDKGNFESRQDPNNPANVNIWTLAMFGDAQYWDPGTGFFTLDTHPTEPEADNLNPVVITVDGNMNNVDLQTTKQTWMTIGGNMLNSSLNAQNHRGSDITFVNVAGQISYPGVYTTETLGGPILTYSGLPYIGPLGFQENQWYSVLFLLLDVNQATTLADGTLGFAIPNTVNINDPKSLAAYANTLRAFSDTAFQTTVDNNSFLGFNYDPTTKTLAYQFQMPDSVRVALEGLLDSHGNPTGLLPIIKLDPKTGLPLTQVIDGKEYFVTTDATFAPPSVIEALYTSSLKSVANPTSLAAVAVGGPGTLNITAGSLDLGSSGGILSTGPGNGVPASEATSGATINVNVSGDISMLSSTIASFGGGDVNVTSGGNLSLSLGQLSFAPLTGSQVAFCIFTSGHSDFHFTAAGDINIGSSRIGAFNGGSVFCKVTWRRYQRRQWSKRRSECADLPGRS